MSKNYDGFDADFGFEDDDLELDLDFDTAVDAEISFAVENKRAAENEAEAEIEAEPEIETEPETEAEPEIEIEPETEAETQIEPESEFEAEVGAEVEPASEPELEKALDIEPEVEEVSPKAEIITEDVADDFLTGFFLEPETDPANDNISADEDAFSVRDTASVDKSTDYVDFMAGDSAFETAQRAEYTIKSEPSFLDEFFAETEEETQEAAEELSPEIETAEVTAVEEAVDDEAADMQEDIIDTAPYKICEEITEKETEASVTDEETLKKEQAEEAKEKKKAKAVKKAKKAAKSFVKELVTWVLIFAVVVVGLCAINLYVLRPSVVSGHSMDPTLSDGQTIILSQVPYLLGDVERGDIIVIDRQIDRERNFKVQFKEMLRYNAITQSIFFKDIKDEDVFWVKRVIGIEGDIISFENDKVYLNGEEMQEDYILEQEVTNYPNGKTFTVGEGEVFVMGDNRNNSSDSRVLSIPVKVDHIVGKVVN